MAMSPADEKVLVKYINALAQSQQQNFRLEAELEVMQEENASLRGQLADANPEAPEQA